MNIDRKMINYNTLTKKKYFDSLFFVAVYFQTTEGKVMF